MIIPSCIFWVLDGSKQLYLPALFSIVGIIIFTIYIIFCVFRI